MRRGGQGGQGPVLLIRGVTAITVLFAASNRPARLRALMPNAGFSARDRH
jgi:hypothetical protein